MTAEELVKRLQESGLRLVVQGSSLVIEGPADTRSKWRDVVRKHKSELIAFLRCPSVLKDLQRLCPLLWSTVTLTDGRSGILWGVSAHGAAVLLYETGVIHTIDPLEIQVDLNGSW